MNVNVLPLKLPTKVKLKSQYGVFKRLWHTQLCSKNMTPARGPKQSAIYVCIYIMFTYVFVLFDCFTYFLFRWPEDKRKGEERRRGAMRRQESPGEAGRGLERPGETMRGLKKPGEASQERPGQAWSSSSKLGRTIRSSFVAYS